MLMSMDGEKVDAIVQEEPRRVGDHGEKGQSASPTPLAGPRAAQGKAT